jgi:hypothetical protein
MQGIVLPLFDLVPLTCRAQCSGLGMWISLEDKEFIQSADHLLLLALWLWLSGASKRRPPFDKPESLPYYWLCNLLQVAHA